MKFERFVFVQADDRLGLWVTLHIRKGAWWHIVRIPWSKSILRVLECLPYCKQWLHCTYKSHTSTVSIPTPSFFKYVATIALVNDNHKVQDFNLFTLNLPTSNSPPWSPKHKSIVTSVVLMQWQIQLTAGHVAILDAQVLVDRFIMLSMLL